MIPTQTQEVRQLSSASSAQTEHMSIMRAQQLVYHAEQTRGQSCREMLFPSVSVNLALVISPVPRVHTEHLMGVTRFKTNMQSARSVHLSKTHQILKIPQSLLASALLGLV